MQSVTKCASKARNLIGKNSKRRLAKAIKAHTRATRRAEKQAVLKGDSDYRRKSYTSWDVI